MDLSRYPLDVLAGRVGTPFYFYDGAILDQKFGELAALTDGPGLQCRFAVKANPACKVLETAHKHGMWIDAVSGNEVLRAKRAGFAMGNEPPTVMYTADVFRDNALQVVVENGVLPNIGSPGMIRELAEAGYRGPVALRINPGFGHGHVQACDTGGPSSKHGIWYEDHLEAKQLADDAGFPVVALHAHVGTGPQIREFDENMKQLVALFAHLLPHYPDVRNVNLGGGIPHPYKPDAQAYPLDEYREILQGGVRQLTAAAERPVGIEIEPGRYPVAGMALLVARVKDVKTTRTNEKGPGHQFIMVDAGFNDLVRPAMYGSYHKISVVGQGAGRAPEPFVVAGPLCESGDVFTRDDQELLQPRPLPRPEPGDLVVLHDAGAYGAAMSSNYVSLGRAAQVFWEDGKATLIARRETLEDIVRRECEEAL
ncbi:MAG: diaminopimelate decarboxylase [Dehalococcoidia bacterium]|nr:diaminopimelate decarboxylase [Dehalococcoidia bacterium]